MANINRIDAYVKVLVSNFYLKLLLTLLLMLWTHDAMEILENSLSFFFVCVHARTLVWVCVCNCNPHAILPHYESLGTGQKINTWEAYSNDADIFITSPKTWSMFLEPNWNILLYVSTVLYANTALLCLPPVSLRCVLIVSQNK